MKPKQLASYLEFTVKNKLSVLIAGAPGIGKTDIILQVAARLGAKVILSHPVVSDPTDFKGLPFATNGKAHFLPYGDLEQLINADSLTICFLDDLGQASTAVQAACMQLLLARQIGEHKVSDHVVFVAATNRKEDKAGVTGLLEPVKSRFRAGIITLETDADEWIEWALENNMPVELMSFIRLKPDFINKFNPTRDLTNSASPRTIASVGMVQMAGLPSNLHMEVFKGIAGEIFAAEYTGFLEVFRSLPDMNEILTNPNGAKVPTEVSARHALTGALAHMMNKDNIGNILTYLNRMPKEFGIATMKNVESLTKKDKEKAKIYLSKHFAQWGKDNYELFGLN